MPQVALVTDEHDDDVRVGVVAQLLQPSHHVLVRLDLADVVDQQSADGAPVVGGCDGPVALLPGRVPDLGLDRLRIDLDRAGGELDADGRLRVKVELVPRESAQQVRFADSRIADKDN